MEAMENGAPLLPNSLAYFACEPYARYEGGDHEIFVGRVLAFRHRTQAAESRPLIFYKGEYHALPTEAGTQSPSDLDMWLHGW